MKRKEFITTAASPIDAAGAESADRVHIVSLGFDDGFRKSCEKVAEIHERFGLSACFNIVASASDPDTGFSDPYASKHPIGGWELWNELADRGHEIMPHGWRHAHLGEMPLAEARGLIIRCLDRFSERLRGFEPQKSVFSFPYNQSTPELEAWLPEVVMGFRTGGGGINPLPTADTLKITTEGYGPDDCGEHLERRLDELLAGPSGWLVYTMHGLDDEGWGPIRADHLESLLSRLVKEPTVRVVPMGRAIIKNKG